MTSASSFGRVVTDVQLRIDRGTRDVVSAQAENLIVRRDVEPAADITDLIAEYDAIAAPFRDRVIGQITSTIDKAADASGENPAGNLIADAQLAATAPAGFGRGDRVHEPRRRP